MPILVWKPPLNAQGAILRAAGADVDALKAAGFRWNKDPGAWEANDTPDASALYDSIRRTVTAGFLSRPGELEQPKPAEFVQQIKQEVAAAHGLTPEQVEAAGQAEKAGPAVMTVAGLPILVDHDPATALQVPSRESVKLEAARMKARELADRLDRDAEDGERPRDMGTPKRMAQGMHARLEAAVARRAAAILRAWADDPTRLPEWRPKRAEAEAAAKRVLKDVPNGWHSYHVEGAEPYPSTDPTVLALRNAYPKALGNGAETPAQRIERMEAAIRFNPIPGFFPTPPAVIERMLELADVREGHAVLEPSAGNGFLAEAARKAGGIVECCEINGQLRAILEAKGFRVVAPDCLEFANSIGAPDSFVDYDRVLMNPPFEKGQDREHIRRMFDLLKPGGRLVAVCSTGPFQRTQTADVSFRLWLVANGAEVEDVEPGAFAGADAFRKTGVSVKLVTIDRRG